MKYSVGMFISPDKRKNPTFFYVDDQKEWTFSDIQLKNYQYYKSSNSADLRDKVKWIRMEEKFREQYNHTQLKLLINYEY